jgi:hypothetical protein
VQEHRPEGAPRELDCHGADEDDEEEGPRKRHCRGEHLSCAPASASEAKVRPAPEGFAVRDAEARTIAAEPIEKISVVRAVTISTRRRRSFTSSDRSAAIIVHASRRRPR